MLAFHSVVVVRTGMRHSLGKGFIVPNVKGKPNATGRARSSKGFSSSSDGLLPLSRPIDLLNTVVANDTLCIAKGALSQKRMRVFATWLNQKSVILKEASKSFQGILEHSIKGESLHYPICLNKGLVVGNPFF